MFPQVRLNTQNATRLVSRNVINLALLLFSPSTSPPFFLGALLVLVPVSLVNLGFPHCFLALSVASCLGDNITDPFRSLHFSINQSLNPLISSASLSSAFRRPPAVESVAASSRIRATFHTFEDTWRHLYENLCRRWSAFNWTRPDRGRAESSGRDQFVTPHLTVALLRQGKSSINSTQGAWFLIPISPTAARSL